jgi:heme/copper-type cytochrome/quinol oxidase subunit 2
VFRGESRKSIAADISAVVSVVMLGLILGLLATGATINLHLGGTTNKLDTSVDLTILPDYHGNTRDAFVAPNSQTDNTVYVPVNTPINFTIDNLDTSLNENFNASAGIPFTIYHDNGTYTAPVTYTGSQKVSLMVGHTFTTQFFNIPLVPDSTIAFSFTFAHTGTYVYQCFAPCGIGMTLPMYMQGQIVVK